MLKKLALLVIASLLLAPAAFAASYQIDPAHTQIHFTVPHLVVFKVRGNFNEFAGTVEADAASNTLSGAAATIQVASIDTRNQKRDDHLRSADFFEAAKYPEISFVSKKVEGSGSNITVTGDLTIKGITKEVVLRGGFLGATTDPWGNQRAGFEATGKVNRRDFGLLWNKALETGGMVVGDEIEIGLEVEAVMK
jgi:polyisoprenoid-binding protein YceI